MHINIHTHIYIYLHIAIGKYSDTHTHTKASACVNATTEYAKHMRRKKDGETKTQKKYGEESFVEATFQHEGK